MDCRRGETVCARYSARAVPLTGGTSTLIGPPRLKLHYSSTDNFSSSQQVDIFVDLVEREHLEGVADLALSSERHDLAQVGVIAPE